MFPPPADTQAERNGLHADVFPFLAEMCRDVGLQFEPSDMVRGRLFSRDRYHRCTGRVHFPYPRSRPSPSHRGIRNEASHLRLYSYFLSLAFHS